MGWQESGLCGQMDPETADVVFFGAYTNQADGQRHRPEHIEAARNICGTCPVRQTCLDEALRSPERYDRNGIRAGLLPRERKALRGPVTVVDRDAEWVGGPVGDVRRRRPVQTD